MIYPQHGADATGFNDGYVEDSDPIYEFVNYASARVEVPFISKINDVYNSKYDSASGNITTSKAKSKVVFNDSIETREYEPVHSDGLGAVLHVSGEWKSAWLARKLRYPSGLNDFIDGLNARE